MAFTCDKCGKPQLPRTKAKKVVTETRETRYSNETRDGNYKISFGSEIVKEITVCPDCA